MLRYLYIRLLLLHPAHFRQQFGDDMLETLDNATGIGARVFIAADALASLFRQWVFRSEYRQPLLAGAPFEGSTNVPRFQSIEPYKPRPAAIIYGGLLTLVIFGAAPGMIAKGGKVRAFLIGAHRPSPHVLAVDRGSIADSELNTTVKLGPEKEDPLRPIASFYFKAIRVLKVLDADGDLIISPWEIMTAPLALPKLDKDEDGKLSPEECGFLPGEISKDLVSLARREFMVIHPVLDALDIDHNGEISATEIANSSGSLKKLDRNGDRSLSPIELLPDQAVAKAAFMLFRVDTNRDGIITRLESESEDGRALSEFLLSADRNHDGRVTREELVVELRLRIERGKIARQRTPHRRFPLVVTMLCFA